MTPQKIILFILLLTPCLSAAQTPVQLGTGNVNQVHYIPSPLRMDKSLALPFLTVATGDTAILAITANKQVIRLSTEYLFKLSQPPKYTTTQRNQIPSPVAGFTIYNTTTNTLNFYNGTAWKAVVTDP